MGVFTPRPPSHNGKAGATMHLDERKVQVQPGSKSKAWYFDHVLPVIHTLENIKVLPLCSPIEPIHAPPVAAPCPAPPPPMPRLLAAVGPARPGTSPTDTSTVQAVSSTSCRGGCAAAAGPRPAGASSSPAPYLYPRQLQREIHVIGCSASLPSHLSSIILCLSYLTSKSTLLPLALPHLVSLFLNYPATAQTTIPLSLPTSTYPIIYFFLSSLHHHLWPLRLIALGPHSDNAKSPFCSPKYSPQPFPHHHSSTLSSLSSSQHIPSDLSAVPVSSSVPSLAFPALFPGYERIDKYTPLYLLA
ncbi:hypothetical protein CPAR01_00042 [Colletotrichum paranaense]|uniref:Uncharacterized protein n=1 Tax=Colletotrichum paranaense TaxID=1914294 RepID=A0ABQ9T2T5_9PEZI|nr:uncharacterized protein CPAR01_00042 [Colletotrichum paranaense]KAK1546075.1 hypothetical protein CPAR01_00042 [Colletotrichum paranaense]